jgi:hypothetical protein
MAGKVGMKRKVKSKPALRGLPQLPEPPSELAAYQFKKGRAYRFLPRIQNGTSGRWPIPEAKTGYVYLSQERGRGVAIQIFQNIAGKWRESFTPAQLGDYEVRKARV